MPKWDFRDVSIGIKKIREFLLGRESVFHHRFPPTIASRTIPPPDIPRGPKYKYAAQWYLDRDILNSVKPPVVAPIAEGCSLGARPFSAHTTACGQIKFPSELPTPGCVWWWDAHCYYKEVNVKPCGPPRPDTPVVTLPKSLTEAPPQSPVPKLDPCAEIKKPVVCAPSKPPCKLDPCKVIKPDPPKLPEEPCDPCKPPKKS